MQIILCEASVPMAWKQPQTLKQVFDKQRHAQALFGRNQRPLNETMLWPVLLGLDAIEYDLMVHATIFVHGTHNEWLTMGLQVTTRPKVKKQGEIPVIVKDGELLVEIVTSRPGVFVPDKQTTPEYWRNLFEEEFAAVRSSAYEELRAAQTKAAELQKRFDAIAPYLPCVLQTTP